MKEKKSGMLVSPKDVNVISSVGQGYVGMLEEEELFDHVQPMVCPSKNLVV